MAITRFSAFRFFIFLFLRSGQSEVGGVEVVVDADVGAEMSLRR